MTDFFASVHPFDTDVAISGEEFWAQPFRLRDESFAKLRADAPV